MKYNDITQKVFDAVGVDSTNNEKITKYDAITLAWISRRLYLNVIELLMDLKDEVDELDFQNNKLPGYGISIYFPIFKNAESEYEIIKKRHNSLYKRITDRYKNYEEPTFSGYSEIMKSVDYKSLIERVTTIFSIIDSCIYKKDYTKAYGIGDTDIDNMTTKPSRTAFKWMKICESIMNVIIEKCDSVDVENAWAIFGSGFAEWNEEL